MKKTKLAKAVTLAMLTLGAASNASAHNMYNTFAGADVRLPTVGITVVQGNPLPPPSAPAGPGLRLPPPCHSATPAIPG